MSSSPIRYDITPVDPFAHVFEVRVTVADPNEEGELFALPAWIPGSYMIRDFAKNIIRIHAESHGKDVPVQQIDKHTWKAVPKKGASLSIVCAVYAWDLSVRGAHLDASHGFFNGTSVFFRVIGREHLPCLVDIRPPPGKAYKNWRVATSLAEAKGHKGAARRFGFGLYAAEDYHDLIDHPVEMGDFTLAQFQVCGVQHDIAITGRHDCDTNRLTQDLAKICTWQIQFFGEPAPMDRYVFLITAVGDGYGGLEHRRSTALLCARNDLPNLNQPAMTDAYRTFLGLCSHEYFHTWNVKRIRPTPFLSYDLNTENYTTLLWAFEGITSYYDDLALLRAGVISAREYLDLLQKNISNVLRTPGRLNQTVAESSFNAWTKFYRQDENSPNAIVSYYAKGALIALALDCTLRAQSKASLDDVMRTLWDRFGRQSVGVEPNSIRLVAEELSGLNLGSFFKHAIDGTTDLPLASLLSKLGVTLTMAPANSAPVLGIKRVAGNEPRINTAFTGGSAQRAGLSAGDLLIAIDGIRVTSDNLDNQLKRKKAGDRVRIHAFRRDELIEAEVILDPPPETECKLEMAPSPSSSAKRLRDAWLGALPTRRSKKSL